MNIPNSNIRSTEDNLARTLRLILEQQAEIMNMQQNIINTIYDLQHDPLIMYKQDYDNNFNGITDRAENINGGNF